MEPSELEDLRQFAITDRQRETIDTLIREGSQRKAATAMGINHKMIAATLSALRKRGARQGHAPGHWGSGVAPGYLMGKVTVQRDESGAVERTWERQSPEYAGHWEALRAAAETMAEGLPRLEPIAPPAASLEALCNLYTFTDYHLGMLAWHKEGGGDWDVKIAERMLVKALEQLVAGSPRARVGIVNLQGDFMHYDGLTAVTPLHGHVLDADGRFSNMVAAAIRVIRRLVDIALMRHDEVHLIIAEGNHDIASSVWLRQMFTALYEAEPRLSVNQSEIPYYVFQHGKTMLCFHHGHMRKNEQLPLLFAAQFPVIWGATTKRYAHTGHRHHVEEREHSGMTVIQHPTLAARDAYAARGGWISERQASAITYHSEFGQVARNTVTPEMLAA